MDVLNGKTLILASKSPRRRELLDLADIPYNVVIKEIEEIFPKDIAINDVAVWLSELKSSVFNPSANEIILTADTIVICNNKILGKPKNMEEAQQFLRLLSGQSHEVITGFTLKSKSKIVHKSVISHVTMNALTDKEITYYLEKYLPLDKAGSYGIQEWLGFTKVKAIKGSYPNIMGLPIHEVYESLKVF